MAWPGPPDFRGAADTDAWWTAPTRDGRRVFATSGYGFVISLQQRLRALIHAPTIDPATPPRPLLPTQQIPLSGIWGWETQAGLVQLAREQSAAGGGGRLPPQFQVAPFEEDLRAGRISPVSVVLAAWVISGLDVQADQVLIDPPAGGAAGLPQWDRPANETAGSSSSTIRIFDPTLGPNTSQTIETRVTPSTPGTLPGLVGDQPAPATARTAGRQLAVLGGVTAVGLLIAALSRGSRRGRR